MAELTEKDRGFLNSLKLSRDGEAILKDVWAREPARKDVDSTMVSLAILVVASLPHVVGGMAGSLLSGILFLACWAFSAVFSLMALGIFGLVYGKPTDEEKRKKRSEILLSRGFVEMAFTPFSWKRLLGIAAYSTLAYSAFDYGFEITAAAFAASAASMFFLVEVQKRMTLSVLEILRFPGTAWTSDGQ